MTRSAFCHARRLGFLCVAAAALAILGAAPDTRGGDWPQWRGPGRDAKVSDFKAPKSWPKELKQQWKITPHAGAYGYYFTCSVGTGECLEVTGSTLYQKVFHNITAQEWSILPAN